MKKTRFFAALGLSLGTGILFGSTILAAQPIKVNIDGTNQQYDQAPVMQNGRVLVPLRGVFESLQAEVDWNQATQEIKATKQDTKIGLQIGSKQTKINNIPKDIDVPAQMMNGRTMVPLRFIGEALQAKVVWDSPSNTVYISTTGKDPVIPKTTNTTKGGTYKGIKTLYGNHAYGSKTQEQYDIVMDIIQKAIETSYDSDEYSFGGRYPTEAESYLANPNQPAAPRTVMAAFKNMYDPLVEAGVSKEEIQKVARIWSLAVDISERTFKPWMTKEEVAHVMEGERDPKPDLDGDGSPDSAYISLIKGESDCDPTAYVWSAVYDAMGYNTAIVAGRAHAMMLVQINGVWFEPIGGHFLKMGKEITLKKGFWYLTEPTFK